ncbi:hypothetical protein SS50377_25540 [Spironucleus salmonicida]|uniref:Uncharacterized protein n=1 Tax=Spironucleus salmonicida TaxID=348837 RepID=V6LL45_9EUKA|nr:hypothetical protein SS50377_25540 [Spironucleus salmonicida]|eukprot:EST45088.1 Hypothetical protein SS50377_15108 [Spironucleus salmonicida]
MFTASPPLQDDIRVLADVFWRYAKCSKSQKYRISSYFVFIGCPRLRLTETTTVIQKSITSRFIEKVYPPNDSIFSISSLQLTNSRPFKVQFQQAITAGGELRQFGSKKYKISNSEQFLFASPFASDFVIQVQRIQQWDDEIQGVLEKRVGQIQIFSGTYCNFEVSGGIIEKNNEKNNFIEIVILFTQFDQFGEVECKTSAEEFLNLLKKLSGELQ